MNRSIRMGIYVMVFVAVGTLLSGCGPFVDNICEPEFTHKPDLVGGTFCSAAEVIVHYDELRDIRENGWPM